MKRLFCVCLLVFAACRNGRKADTAKSIKLSRDSQNIVVSGIDYQVLQSLKQDSLTLTQWHSLLAVYRMPVDTDLKDFQQEQPGIYKITGGQIIFKPDTGFKKNEVYFARFYGRGILTDQLKLLQGKSKLNGPAYTEKVFHF